MGHGDGTKLPMTPALIAATVILLAGAAVAWPVGWPIAAVVVVFLLTVTLWANRRDDLALRDAAALSAALWILIRLPVVGIWPLPAALALVAVIVLTGPRGTLSRWRKWFRVGTIGPSTRLLCAVIVVLTAVALLVWQQSTDGGLPSTYTGLIDSVPTPVAIAGIFLFLVVNGAVEDSVWSGVLLTAARGTMPAPVAIAVTVLSFGIAHLDGVPNGPIGVVMVIAWGIVLSLLRLRTGGMLATYIAHVLADATIVALLVPSLLSTK
ncbi:CAAX protease self-immunity [Cryobacterium flavum]|uniref:CAAX protease self-immunity n=1 Tax=Cryobacterium flavum TaxID=1424659 RepID=A0A5E9G4G2_9MICO|nr:CAAX protease self-immunity [Cryobacterium flavum]